MGALNSVIMLSKETRDTLLQFHNDCESERYMEMASSLSKLLMVNEVGVEDTDLSVELLLTSFDCSESNPEASDLIALLSFYLVTAPARIRMLAMLATHINESCNESIRAVLNGKMQLAQMGADPVVDGKDEKASEGK